MTKRQAKKADRPLSLRLPLDLIERIDRASEESYRLTFPGRSPQRPPLPSRGEMIRYLLERGVDVVEQTNERRRLADAVKKGDVR